MWRTIVAPSAARSSNQCSPSISSGLTTRNALPVVVSAGITTAGQADLDALAEQVRAVAASQHTVTRAIDLISAWSVRDR